MVAVATTLPCGYSGIEAELSLTYTGSGNTFSSTDLGRWETWLESLAGNDHSGPGNTVLILVSDVIRFFINGGSSSDREETAAAAVVALNNSNAGLGFVVEVEVTDYETYTFDGTSWISSSKGNPLEYWNMTAVSANRPIRRSTGSREDVSSTSCFDECRLNAIAHGAIVRIKRR